MKYLKYFEAMEFSLHYGGLFSQYTGEKFTLVGGTRVSGGLNIGEKSYYRLRYIIYSNELFKQTQNQKESEIGTVEIGRDDDGLIAVLIDIKIKPKFRKSGYGRQIISEIVDTTKDGLHVYDIKKSAIKFWQKIGAELTTKFNTINGFIPKMKLSN